MSTSPSRLAIFVQFFSRRVRTPRELGALGEARAASYYRWRGYRVVARNYRAAEGEIDLIVRRGRRIVFVEVKTRDEARIGEPFEAVDHEKQLRIAAIAERYLVRHRLDQLTVRFDVASLVWNGRKFDLQLFADAFRPIADPVRPWRLR